MIRKAGSALGPAATLARKVFSGTNALFVAGTTCLAMVPGIHFVLRRTTRISRGGRAQQVGRYPKLTVTFARADHHSHGQCL
jgi:hypothetical protein